ncbi:MAG: hypothetical protein IH897_02285 [Planctomycetes bacterium]|nr:hypothetical protein [Planctomycetota bacterium]
MSRTARTVLVYVAVFLLVVMAVNAFMSSSEDPIALELDQFEKSLAAGDIANVELRTRSEEVRGEFTEQGIPPTGETTFEVVYPPPESNERGILPEFRQWRFVLPRFGPNIPDRTNSD